MATTELAAWLNATSRRYLDLIETLNPSPKVQAVIDELRAELDAEESDE
jgi:hypothetical protein